jgi:UTP--glucose-1-phosphate uridylyltransferase
MNRTIRTAVFPVAGLGTRLLPATKSVPKELLPVYDTPLIQFAIDEACAAGVERLVFVSHRSKSAIEHYVHPDRELEEALASRDKAELLDVVASMGCGDVAEVVFTEQEEALGLGHAVACARDHVLDGPIAVVLPDDLILGPNCLAEMASAYANLGCGHLVATMEVPQAELSRYGILQTVGERVGRLGKAVGIVEKPAPGEAPSSLAVVGRYVLDACIFDDLEATEPGSGGEIQLTDAIARGIDRVGLAGYRFSGTRYDCGNADGLLDAGIALRDLRQSRSNVKFAT